MHLVFEKLLAERKNISKNFIMREEEKRKNEKKKRKRKKERKEEKKDKEKRKEKQTRVTVIGPR
jgi:hypothetical protein